MMRWKGWKKRDDQSLTANRMAKQHRKGDSKPKSSKNAVERTCIVYRKVKPADKMLRFVIDPANNVVPDLKCVLPGRGVWVTATKADVDLAVRKGLFARSFKCAVRVDAALGERIETMLETAALHALSFAAKAGLVVTGFEKVQATLGKNRLRALVFASDGAKDGIRKMRSKLNDEAGTKKVAVHQSLRSEQMALALGRSNVIHAALLQGGASEMYLETVGRLEQFRSAEDEENEDETNI